MCGHAFDGLLFYDPPSSHSGFQLILFVEQWGPRYNDTHHSLTPPPALPHPIVTLPLPLLSGSQIHLIFPLTIPAVAML